MIPGKQRGTCYLVETVNDDCDTCEQRFSAVRHCKALLPQCTDHLEVGVFTCSYCCLISLLRNTVQFSEVSFC